MDSPMDTVDTIVMECPPEGCVSPEEVVLAEIHNDLSEDDDLSLAKVQCDYQKKLENISFRPILEEESEPVWVKRDNL